MKHLIPTVAVCVLLAGCATSPTSIEPAYVSTSAYEGMSCSKLATEAGRVSDRAARVAGVQNDKATRDAVAMGVGLVVFWPALFFIHGDQGNAAGLAQLKGEMVAIEEVSRAKNCDITFQQI